MRNHDNPPTGEELDILQRLSNIPLGPLNLSAISIATNLYRAGQCLRVKMERERLARHNLSWTAFSMLYDLWIWGTLETRELAISAGVTTATVSNVTNTLERRELCVRRTDPNDRRLVQVSITEKGTGIMQELYPDFHRGEVEIIEGLSEREQELLAELLRKVIRNMS
ncbi:MarR family transcriptional regulator [Paenibacillus filicis]|uniref:MarR family transcriptional regulator n=1 Tax=Paenibacillus gyeongsangnamensis TaxID=3388067 RepID=A0ABT4QE79_9BACL|nr:MarR family transcriptional regulator [Paenibacillus filicis]MCZ8515178.1 MarR family transcriptional regulator [Paenibacillus filicis]